MTDDGERTWARCEAVGPGFRRWWRRRRKGRGERRERKRMKE